MDEYKFSFSMRKITHKGTKKSLSTDDVMNKNFEKLQEICKFFKLGDIVWFKSLSNIASCVFLFQLQTTQGVYGIKSYSLQKKNQLLSSIKIKKIYTGEENYFYEDSEGFWIVFSWHEGSVLKLSEIKLRHVQKIAKILGKMHKMQIEIPNVLPVYDFSFHPKLKESLIISHGDLIPQNVVWKNNDLPILIDWENAGLINQDLEVFNTAVNWAGIESGKLNMKYYREFIKCYKEVYPREVQIGFDLIKASLGSWIKWWEETGDPRTPKVIEILTSTRFR